MAGDKEAAALATSPAAERTAARRVKKEPINRSKLGPDYIAPDGGHGWFVALAAGCSNLTTFPVLQQFGLIFRDRLATLGITTSQITTIINVHSAFTYGIGLANGPLFRRFTYRQVGFCGAFLVVFALLFTSISNSFLTYLLTFAVLYGSGIGITTSANSLALNTYFKEKRRIATGISWTITGFGPIIAPHLITLLLFYFGVQGTLWIFCGIALNAVACSLVFQPAMRHSKHHKLNKNGTDAEINEAGGGGGATEKLLKELDMIECNYCQSANKRRPSIFSSQYLYNADDVLATGYEIIDPGMPMLAHANDGWFGGSGKRSLDGSKASLTSRNASRNASRKASYANLAKSNRPSDANLAASDSRKASFANLPISNRPSAANLGGSDSRKASLSNLGSSNRPSYANLGVLQGVEFNNEGKKGPIATVRSIKNLKIEEHVEEDCPSQKAPQDLSETEKNMIPRGQATTPGTGGPETESSFKIGKVPINDPNNNAGCNSISSPEAKYLLDNHSIRSYHRTDSFSGGGGGRKRSNTFNREKETLKEASSKLQEYIDHGRRKSVPKCTCDEERQQLLMALQSADTEKLSNVEEELEEDEEYEEEEQTFTLWEKIVIFFDLDLLRDFTFVVLMVGITIANFAELNFSILTPFVLGDFGFSKPQTALLMSLLASFDIVFRFFIPFLAGRIGWENRTFFLVGVMMMAMGRVVLSFCSTYAVAIPVFCFIGIGKGLRTVFMALVIPSHVPLDRLPGATGIHLLFSGMFYMLAGPIVGVIKDTFNYPVTLHYLNIFTYLTVISWTLEGVYRRRQDEKRQRIEQETEAANGV